MKVLDYIKKNRNFILGLFVLLAMRWSFADQNRVPSGSMLPTIQIGDHIAVNKMAYDLKIPFTSTSILSVSNPERGDIVTFLWPGDNSTLYVKRIIGIPGDHVKIENGFITINGKNLQRVDLNQSDILTYTEQLGDHKFTVQRLPLYARNEVIELTVPQDSYFFMGDNRDNSSDSREWGFVKREALKGKVHFVLWNIKLESFVPKMDFSRLLKILI